MMERYHYHSNYSPITMNLIHAVLLTSFPILPVSLVTPTYLNNSSFLPSAYFHTFHCFLLAQPPSPYIQTHHLLTQPFTISSHHPPVSKYSISPYHLPTLLPSIFHTYTQRCPTLAPTISPHVHSPTISPRHLPHTYTHPHATPALTMSPRHFFKLSPHKPTHTSPHTISPRHVFFSRVPSWRHQDYANSFNVPPPTKETPRRPHRPHRRHRRHRGRRHRGRR